MSDLPPPPASPPDLPPPASPPEPVLPSPVASLGVPLFVAGTRGLCPRCGRPTMYAGLIRFADRCSACGLDFTQFNVGDGPAAFLTLILGTIITAAAVIVQVAYEPPVWLQMLIWTPVTLAGVVASLRVAKGVLMTVEYRQAAREGRVKP